MLKASDIAEIAARHAKVEADPRFTDKLAHRDRGRLLEHVAGLEAEAAEARGLALNLYTITTGPAVRRAG